MRAIGLGGSQAPCAAAGMVRSDPFPIRACALCADLTGSVQVFVALDHSQLFDSVDWKRALLQLGVSVAVVVQLGSVRAHGVFDNSFFG